LADAKFPNENPLVLFIKAKIMIETLCIAAEITAVLLILSIAIPIASSKKSRSKSQQEASSFDSKLLLNCEQSIAAIRCLLYLQASKWIRDADNANSEQEANSNNNAARTLRDHLNTIEPLQVSSSFDSVTLLRDREEIESLFHVVSQWEPLDNLPVWVGLIQIDHLDQIDEQHGPVASELALRQATLYLRDRLSGYGPLVRFNHQSFAIALVGWSQKDVIEFLDSVRHGLSCLPVTVGETEFSMTASASAVSRHDSTLSDELWERLEDGIVEAVAAGADRGRWYSTDDALWHPMRSESTPDAQNHSDHSKSTNESVAPEADEKQQDDKPSKDELKPVGIETTSPEAINSDDISALFKATEVQRRSSDSPFKSKDTVAPVSNLPAAPSKAENANEDDVLNDDIAALFKAAKEQKDSNATAAEPKISVNNPSKLPSSPDTPEDLDSDLAEAAKATNDDIAALFATFNNAKKTKKSEAQVPAT